MAIPPFSIPPALLRRIVLLTGLLFGVASISVAIALGTGALAGPRPPPPQACPPPRVVPCPQCPPPSPAAPPMPAVPPPSAPEGSVEPSPRYRVCEANGGRVLVRPMPRTSAGGFSLGVHCGSSVHVLGFEERAPRRVLRIDAALTPAGLFAQPGGLVVGEISANDRADLIVGTFFNDAHASPRAGALHMLRRQANGAFEDPRLLAPLSVGALAAGQFEPSKGLDLAVLQLEDARLARPNMLLLLRGGPAPVKHVALTAGVGMNQLAVADLDLDGHDDVILAGPEHAVEVLFLDAQGKLRERRPLEITGASAILTADLDGDGHRDVMFSGTDAQLLLAAQAGPKPPQRLATLDGWSNVQVLDWNDDRKLDLIGLREHALWGAIQTDRLEFEARKLPVPLGPQFALAAVFALESSGVHGKRELVLVGSPEQASTQVEVQIVDAAATATSAAHSVKLLDAPLSQHMVFP